MQFNLSISDFAALAGLLVLVTGSQYLIGASQNEASEARLEGKIELASLETKGQITDLSDDFNSLRAEIKEMLSAGIEYRNNDIMTALSTWTDDGDAFKVKVANFPTQGNLYDYFFELASTDDAVASVYALNSSAIGTVTIEDYDEPKAVHLKALLSEAETSSIDGLEVMFEFDTAMSGQSREQMINRMNAEIQVLTSKVRALSGN